MSLTMNGQSPQTNFVAYVHPSVEADLRELQAAALTEPQRAIRRAIKSNERKARSQSGKHRSRKWLLSKQAQCAIYGHVHRQNGRACYYCGYEFE